jgi:hypothetical protein
VANGSQDTQDLEGIGMLDSRVVGPKCRAPGHKDVHLQKAAKVVTQTAVQVMQVCVTDQPLVLPPQRYSTL